MTIPSLINAWTGQVENPITAALWDGTTESNVDLSVWDGTIEHPITTTLPPPTIIGSDTQAVNATSITLTLPPDIEDGDIGIAVWVGQPTTPAVSEPAGWTRIDTQIRSGSMESYLYQRTLTAADSGQTLTWTTPSQQKPAASVIVVRNVLSATHTSAVYTTSSTTHPAPQITPAAPVAIAAFYTERGSAASTAVTPPATLASEGSAFNVGGGATGIGLAASTTIAPKHVAAHPGDWQPDKTQGGVICWTIAFANATPTPPPPVDQADLVYPLVAAHRFGVQEGPQNTLYTANLVLNTGPSRVGECDIRANADGTPVVWHDATVDDKAGSGETGLVADYTDAMWSALTVAWPWGTAPPEQASTWGEILDTWGGHRVLVPELKDDAVVDAFISGVRARGLRRSMIVQSSSYPRALQLVDAGFHVLYLCSSSETAFATYAGDGIEAVGFERSVITPQHCVDAHTAGLRVWVYTVNTTIMRDDMFNMGVDAVFSDKPTLLWA